MFKIRNDNMKKIVVWACLLLISGCVNSGRIVSGNLVVNDTKHDLSGNLVTLNDDCSPDEVLYDLPYCGSYNVNKNKLCTTTPNLNQIGYKIVQVINKNDALVCTANVYGGCFGNIEYIKNLGNDYEYIVDDVYITDNFLIKTDPYTYNTAAGVAKTVNGYELVSNFKVEQITYMPDDQEVCIEKEYSYSKTYSLDEQQKWIKH